MKLRLQKEVANPENLFDYKKELNFYTSPPKRTDIEEDYKEKKWVYVISNPMYPDEYKVGIAKNYQSRLNSYQISDPNRGYKMEYTYHTPHYREIEKHIHDKFDHKHEWIQANKEDVIKEIRNFNVYWFFIASISI